MTHHADYDKHSDDELRDGISKADEQVERITHDQEAKERGPDALEANRDQREAMAEELDRRDAD